ncbi:TIGR03086 family protein [Dactylosporangium vinaceum]|uniref:TIGR03086 family metal-binding protein n=1 Tax=Dactylosporangium vinaceum TaxID=53362 RepID=A0ABV5MHE8_9ACTN|nr:TIGR03086 family metal-binding protein [Dactylosporangium vinaceum]UAB94803.1 TIGR03086 family protein [Dactylosporangium vinaceum]
MAFPDYRAADAIAVRASVKLLDGPLDLTLPTPCAGWNLADLLAHMTIQHLGFAAAARGESWPLARWTPPPLAADPAAAYAAAAEEVIAAFAAADLSADIELAEIAPVPIPAWRGLGAHTIDYVVHGWDVAQTLGLTWELPEDVLVETLPIAEAVPATTKAFAAPIAAPAGASTMDRILLRLGRVPR